MAYICSVCHTPTTRDNRCETCGWVRTIVVNERNGKVRNGETISMSFSKELGAGSVAFFTEDTQHITGGRYYSWWLATAMQHAGFDVHIFTNRLPMFLDEFKEYKQPSVHVVPNLHLVDVVADFYVGSPIVGDEIAIQLGRKYGRKSYCMIFDPFPMMEKYRGKHNWPGWDRLLVELKEPHVQIISLCQATSDYIYSWLDKSKNQVHHIYPPVNSKERDKSPKRLKKKNQVCFVSRLDHHKKLNHILSAVRDTKCSLQVVTSIDGIGFEDMVRVHGMKKRVKVNMKMNDEDKFRVIKESKAMVNGAIFEGFGMWLAEAISVGTPVVCYEYPTFREIWEYAGKPDNVYFADWNDAEDFRWKLQKALKEKKFLKGTDKFDFKHMVKRCREVFIREPKIGVVMIALNEQQYIGASLKSLMKHKNISKIAVVEGAVELFKHAATEDGLSEDDTAGEVLKVCKWKNGRKIIYDRYGWAKDKSELRNRCLELLGKDFDWIMVVDADEVWKKQDLDKLVQVMKKNPHVGIIWYPAYHFWKRPDLVAVGSQWDKYLFRCFNFTNKSLHWKNHAGAVVDSDGKDVGAKQGTLVAKNVHFYHYGALKEEKRILDKLKYYKERDTDLKVRDTWSNWRKGRETQWTHQGGTVKKFEGTHPPEVVRVLSL